MSLYPRINTQEWIYREQFRTVGDVVDNGGDVSGATIAESGTFDGTNDFIEYTNAEGDEVGTEDFSICFYINTSNATNDGAFFRRIVSKEASSGGRGFAVELDAGVPKLWLQTTHFAFSGASSIADGTRKHIAITADRSGDATLYVDKVAIGTIDISGQSGVNIRSTTNLFIGRYPLTVDGNFDGVLEDLRIYKTLLSSEEVNDIADDTTFQELDDSKSLLSLPLVSNYSDGANQVTENIGSVGSTIQLGDGVTASTFPTQLTNYPHGMSFDGGDDLRSTSAGLQVLGDMTFGGFFKFDSLPSDGTNDSIYVQGASGETEAVNVLYSLSIISGSNVWNYLHEFGSGSNESSSFTTTPIVGIWQHVYIVRDNTAKTATLYIDGEAVEVFTFTSNPSGGGSGVFSLGSNGAGANTFFNGGMQIPRMFALAATQSQIKDLYNKDRSLINV